VTNHAEMQLGNAQTLKQPLLPENTDSAILEERNRDVSEIAEQLGALRDVAKDINELVYEGREKLDMADVHVTNADESTNQAVEELVIANKYACAARWKVLIIVVLILVILLIIAAVLGIILGVVFGTKSN